MNNSVFLSNLIYYFVFFNFEPLSLGGYEFFRLII